MIIEEKLTTQIEGEYDVAVCGGGFAGISAALAATRQGKKVVLFERQYILGGLATAGLVTIYLPLCDGCGHQVSFGIAEELFRLSILHGAEDRLPENWLNENGSRTENDPRFEVQYNPHIFAILIEKLLLDEGVDIMYGTYVTSVRKNDDKIEYLITENKSGRRAYKVGSVVDATGDCDVAYMADAPTQNHPKGNIIAAWYYSVAKNSGYQLHMLGFRETSGDDNENLDFSSSRRFSGLDGKEISEFMFCSHKSIYNDFLLKRQEESELR
ncbi:MAG: FAD-dependent oxidoreductase [Ruminococcaceae bacterium]|nr:FAD-dependent oxidoreductase [Oscillospiraceae bacterium]